jgi:hypothetical protein
MVTTPNPTDLEFFLKRHPDLVSGSHSGGKGAKPNPLQHDRISLLKTQSGSALVIALIMMIVITVIGLASSYTSIYEIIASGNKRASTSAFYGADAQAVAITADQANFHSNTAIPKSSLGELGVSGKTTLRAGRPAPRGRGMGATQNYLHFEIQAVGTESSGTQTTVVEEVVRVLPTAQ